MSVTSCSSLFLSPLHQSGKAISAKVAQTFFLTKMYICDLNRNWISTFGKSTTSRKLNTRIAIFGGFLGQWSFHQIPLSQLFTKTFWDFAPWREEHLMWADIVAKVSAWKKIIWIWVIETQVFVFRGRWGPPKEIRGPSWGSKKHRKRPATDQQDCSLVFAFE